jgi:hypothetical protein
MTQRTIYRTTMLALATMFAGRPLERVSPKPAPQWRLMHQSMLSFSAFDGAPFVTITPDNYRYHGGPKSNDWIGRLVAGMSLKDTIAILVSLAAVFAAYVAVAEWVLHVELLLLESTRLL